MHFSKHSWLRRPIFFTTLSMVELAKNYCLIICQSIGGIFFLEIISYYFNSGLSAIFRKSYICIASMHSTFLYIFICQPSLVSLPSLPYPSNPSFSLLSLYPSFLFPSVTYPIPSSLTFPFNFPFPYSWVFYGGGEYFFLKVHVIRVIQNNFFFNPIIPFFCIP